ncbi:MAG: lytic transglycosylase domain-containing protein [Candidatus Eremiobacteraeota bacterium]|nr:lytic transglycosylase domain-containing protein [Candidatus Eremiobacteraeota bacterium]
MRSKSIHSLFILCLLFVFMVTIPVMADSHVTSPASQDENDPFLAGDTPDENIIDGMATDKTHSISIKNKNEIIWGPEVKRPAKSAVSKKRKTRSKYPAINVRFKVYVTKPGAKTSHKYKKQLSSRAGGSRVAYVNITPIIIREAKRNKISPILLKALIHHESGFNNYARGRSGALGLCQLMPGTARRLGVRDPFNPEHNIKGGAKLLGMLIRQFRSVDRALAAYNLGGGAVLRHGGVPSYARPFIRHVKRKMKW